MGLFVCLFWNTEVGLNEAPVPTYPQALMCRSLQTGLCLFICCDYLRFVMFSLNYCTMPYMPMSMVKKLSLMALIRWFLWIQLMTKNWLKNINRLQHEKFPRQWNFQGLQRCAGCQPSNERENLCQLPLRVLISVNKLLKGEAEHQVMEKNTRRCKQPK